MEKTDEPNFLFQKQKTKDKKTKQKNPDILLKETEDLLARAFLGREKNIS